MFRHKLLSLIFILLEFTNSDKFRYGRELTIEIRSRERIEIVEQRTGKQLNCNLTLSN